MKLGANVNVQDNEGRSPLHCALFWGQDKVAEVLIAAGANLNARSNNGYTVMQFAIETTQNNGSVACVKALLKVILFYHITNILRLRMDI